MEDAMANNSNAVNDVQEEKKTYSFGNAALANKKTHTLFEPIKRGIIQDWDNMELMWGHIFDELNLETKNVNVLMTDSPFNPKENRQKIAEIFFEHFKVKSLAIMNTAALSMYSTGRVSGLVAESGEGISYTVPVFEGYALPHAMIKLEVAGWDVTQQLIKQLEEQKIKVSGEAEHIRLLKEQMCSISQNYHYDMQSNDDPISFEDRSYELPGGEIIQVNHRQRFSSTEVLFNPSLIGQKGKGIAQMAFTSIEKCDSDLKINLFNNIVLAGGSTVMPGFKERFEDEILKLAEHNAKTDINVYADLHRRHAAWIGGSMLASFSTFRDMTITKEEYDNTADIEKTTAILKKSFN